MKMNKIIATVALGLFFACGSADNASKDDNNNQEMTNQTQDTSWKGAYVGQVYVNQAVYDMNVLLRPNMSYVIQIKRPDADNYARFNGNFSIDENNIVTLLSVNDDTIPNQFLLDKNHLVQLDYNKNPISTEAYSLIKISNQDIENKRWKLVELMGKPVAGPSNLFYAYFDSKTGRISAMAGCNLLSFPYTIKDGSVLEVGTGTATKKACPNDQLDPVLTNAFQDSDVVMVNGNQLSISKGKRAPYAKFVLDK